MLLLKIVNNQGVLSWYFPYVAKIDINLPNYLQSLFIRLVLVVQGTPPNDTVQFLHEKAPISPFEHGKSWIIKGGCLYLWRFLFELNGKVLLSLFKVPHIVKIEVFWILFVHNFIFSWWLENILDSLNLGPCGFCLFCGKNSQIFVPNTTIDHDFFQKSVQLFVLIKILVVTIFKQKLVF